MDFLTDTSFWITVMVATLLATIPSFIKPMRLSILIPIIVLWLAVIGWLAFSVSALAALIGAGISLLVGALIFLTTILLTGIQQMAKKRYR
uniref:Uncharacterized protein n=1 Tax=Chlorobium chlorochromatii (strain CaD3) TaxID=340177 RepID=Q3AT21_CHLCH